MRVGDVATFEGQKLVVETELMTYARAVMITLDRADLHLALEPDGLVRVLRRPDQAPLDPRLADRFDERFGQGQARMGVDPETDQGGKTE